jgi:AAA+ ATPase superfamily predicted ATPase
MISKGADMFVNRESELQLLERSFGSGQPELFVLYGRRRVGETELLSRFCEGKRHVFYVADLDVEPALYAGLSG